MGLYDFLVKYKLDYDTLIDMISDLSKFVFMNGENTIRWLDDIYNEKEFKEFKKKYKD